MRNQILWIVMTKKLIVYMTSSTLILLAVLGSFSVRAQNSSEPQWWFNVELIVFKRTLLPSNNENFAAETVIQNTAQNDANNLLYLAALQNASSFKAYFAALPRCGVTATVESAFGASVDFSYQPRPQVFIKDTADSKQGGLNKHDTNQEIIEDTNQEIIEDTNQEIIEDTNQNLSQHQNNLLISSAALLKNILAPFDMSNFITQSASISKINIDNEALTSDQAAIMALTNHVIDINLQLQKIANSAVSLRCVNNQPQPSISDFALPNIGPQLFSDNSFFTGNNQVLARSDLVLQDYAQSVFKQRDITALLYTAWRQEVQFGIENAEFIRVRAGNVLETSHVQSFEQWQKAYSRTNNALVESDDIRFFDILQTSLDNNQSVDWLAQSPLLQNTSETEFTLEKQYEIDGKIKVYLDYVNQVPYLHIDSEFNRFSLVLDINGSSHLSAFPSKQRRRVISKQIHYFDHPAFGLIVRLERFTPPTDDQVIINDTAN
jgi:hypothetical protein